MLDSIYHNDIKITLKSHFCCIMLSLCTHLLIFINTIVMTKESIRLARYICRHYNPVQLKQRFYHNNYINQECVEYR